MSKILVVEDEPIIAQLIEDFLNEEGYQTSHAHSGEEALMVMAHQQPDLVLLDLCLPAMSGVEVCRAMQRDTRLMSVPIIVLTSSTSPSKRKLVYQLGADDYLTKPFDLDELLQHIHAQLHYCEHQTRSELTDLPTGSVVIKAIERSISDPTQRLVVIYVNIEHLDAYNETYSLLEGNDLIKMTAAILREVVIRSGGRGDFLGYDGGGEFVVITEPEHAAAITTEAASRFKQAVAEGFYPAEACYRGYIVACDHHGQSYCCPLAALSFDVVIDSSSGSNLLLTQPAALQPSSLAPRLNWAHIKQDHIPMPLMAAYR